MLNNPLSFPGEESAALRIFLRHFNIPLQINSLDVLLRSARAFADLPYENLSKVLKIRLEQTPRKARRGPEEVIQDYVRYGTGGTCFSLTAAFLHLVRALGWQAEPVLADRHYGVNTHCALLIWIEGKPHLLDPGFLLFDPVEITGKTEKSIRTGFNELQLIPRDGEDAKVDLYTVYQGSRKHRLTFKTSPVDNAEFLKVWDDSFSWDMMNYPLLTKTDQDKQIYLQGNYLQTRGAMGIERQEIPAENLARIIEQQFGIHPEVTQKALRELSKC